MAGLSIGWLVGLYATNFMEQTILTVDSRMHGNMF